MTHSADGNNTAARTLGRCGCNSAPPELGAAHDTFARGLMLSKLGTSPASGSAVSPTGIREIHKRLVEGVRGGEGAPGRYRTVQNYVVNSKTRAVIYTPPAPDDVPELMLQLVHWLRAESTIHPVLLAGIAQFQLVHIHPFVDGNGRTSRLLSTLCLYASGYDFKRLFTLSEFYDRDRLQFYRAIQSVRDQDLDLTSWLEVFVEGLSTQLSEVKAQGELAIRRDVLVQHHQLNARQALALERLLVAPCLDIRTFEELCPGVTRRTLQRDLAALETKGLVVHEGETNHLVYRLKEKA